jgi:heme/copper-type cytochrome/quinol oxidase subunit 2
MNRYGQIKDLLLGDLTTSIFVFGLVVTLLVIVSLFFSNKEREDYDKDYYDRHGSLPK